MEQDVDGVMSEEEARAGGYLPTVEVPETIDEWARSRPGRGARTDLTK